MRLLWKYERWNEGLQLAVSSAGTKGPFTLSSDMHTLLTYIAGYVCTLSVLHVDALWIFVKPWATSDHFSKIHGNAYIQEC